MELSERYIRQLEAEGYTTVYEWSDAPHTHHKEHEHPHDTVVMITDGSMVVTVGDNVTTLQSGDRHEIPAGTTHSAKTGNEWCHYIIGEK